MTSLIEDVRSFWDACPCGSTVSVERDRRAYFNEIEQKRYSSERHIPAVAEFGAFREKDVLEIGCGIGTDGLQFARNGARYVGVDLSPASIEIAKERFSLYSVRGDFFVLDAEGMPFHDQSFDYIYSYGVIHHSPQTERIASEMYRILRPGGTFCLMVYNRSSINYYVEIMFLRKLFRLFLYPQFMPGLIARVTGFPLWKLKEHRAQLLRKRRMTKEEWISINTDGPRCPLAKVYSASEVLDLFKPFSNVRTEVWFFDRSHWPYIGKILSEGMLNWLGRRWGWHRLVFGKKE